ncbi:hypothetical protein AB7C87_01300 [Natrarchaeobius sp. A-rgal3]|uniref:hypothetical protein n=1 Tax=Natrarchaeobius versutus TaxID=1679078 RepID=UPI003510BE15
MEPPVLLRAVAALAFLSMAIGVGWWARSLPRAAHKFCYTVAAAIGVMGVMFAFESVYVYTTGAETALTSIGYGITWMLIALVISAVAGAGRGLTLALVGVAGGRFSLMLVATYGIGSLGEALVGIVLLLALVGSLLVWLYLLLGPLTRIGTTQSRDRMLFFTKLKYFAVLAWLVHTASIGMFGAQVMVGIPADVTRIYLDVIILIGIAGVTLRSAEALEETATETTLPWFEFEPGRAAEAAD